LAYVIGGKEITPQNNALITPQIAVRKRGKNTIDAL